MESEYNIADFEITSSLPPELEGLDAQMLFDLFDIVMKLGEPGEFEMLQFSAFGELKHGFLIAVRPTSSDTSMLLLKKSKFAQDFYLADEGAFTIKTKKIASVVWDIRISFEEAVGLIREVDEIAEAEGLIDSETGERIFNKPTIGERFYKVSEVFSNPDNVLIFSSELSDDLIFAQFDRPQLVRIYQCHQSPFKFACLISNAEAIEETLSNFQEMMITERASASRPLILREEKRKIFREKNTGQFN